MAKKFKTTSKFFRIGTEGATTDGRVIERAWLEQMAATYNPTTYGARVNMEHIKGYTPDSPFRAYGDVVALKTEEVEIGGVKKLVLLAQIEPTADLVTLTKAKQKIYTSMEVQHDFAKTGKAYLVGLAVTDSPASLGTEMLEFSAKSGVLAGRKQDKENLFSAAEEVTLEFEQIEQPDDEPGLLARITAMFSRKQETDEARFADVHSAVEEVATHQVALEAKFATLEPLGSKFADLDKQFADLSASIKKHGEDFAALSAKFDATPAGGATRPPATGGANAIKTDC